MAKPLEKRTEHPFGLPHALNKYPNAPVTAPLANLPPPATDASRAKRGIQQQAADREALPVDRRAGSGRHCGGERPLAALAARGDGRAAANERTPRDVCSKQQRVVEARRMPGDVEIDLASWPSYGGVSTHAP
jgi:hypothetical protein